MIIGWGGFAFHEAKRKPQLRPCPPKRGTHLAGSAGSRYISGALCGTTWEATGKVGKSEPVSMYNFVLLICGFLHSPWFLHTLHEVLIVLRTECFGTSQLVSPPLILLRSCPRRSWPDAGIWGCPHRAAWWGDGHSRFPAFYKRRGAALAVPRSSEDEL